VKWQAWTGPKHGVALPVASEFERAVLPHLDAAYNLARWLVRDGTSAEDVVQDALVRALSYFGSYRGGDARAWLLRIVRNVAYGELAAHKRDVTTSLDNMGDEDASALQVADPAANPETALARQEGLTQLERALAALPTELRECLVLRELEELSYKEIGHVTGAPIGTVMSRLWRARQLLARQAPACGKAEGAQT